jgi:hypothetical protein
MLGTEIPTCELPWGISLLIESAIVSLDEIKRATGLQPGFGSFEKGEEYHPTLRRLLKLERHDSTRLQLLLESRDPESAAEAAISLLREYYANILTLRSTFGAKVAVRLDITYLGDENEEHCVPISPILSALLKELDLTLVVIFLKKSELV